MDPMTENIAPGEDRVLPVISATTTPQQLVEEIAETEGMSSFGTVRVLESTDELHGYPVKRVELVTGGWSDNEQLIDELRSTSFRLLWWHSDHRGGLHVYEIPLEQWTSPEMLFELPAPAQ